VQIGVLLIVGLSSAGVGYLLGYKRGCGVGWRRAGHKIKSFYGIDNGHDDNRFKKRLNVNVEECVEHKRPGLPKKLRERVRK